MAMALTDLYVASGGMESGDRSELLQDRLYVMGEDGKLQDVSESNLPASQENSGAVASADFDQDGDLDLFVASRFETGNFPNSGRNRILLNNGSGKFSDATSELASGLENCGMVNGALWSDANGDGWIDLLLACDWGAVQLWKNEKGQLSNASTEARLRDFFGRWNGITGGDIDNDGDMDYLVTNQGLNQQSATALYRADFFENDKAILLETVSEGGKEWPLRGRNDFLAVEPKTADYGKNPREFVETGIARLFSDEKKKTAEASKSTYVLQNGILVNDGTGKFSFLPLPQIAQCSEGMGAVLTDFNFDGHCDIYLVQNKGRPSLRDSDALHPGVSQLLLGTGDKGNPFRPVSPGDSGIVVFGYGRGVVVTDLNGDDKPDLIASINGSDPAVFVNELEGVDTRPLRVELNSKGKSPAGARITVTISGFPTQTAEYYAGGGYLSQSPPELFFAAPERPESAANVRIQWSDGTETNRKIYFSE